MYWFRIYVLPKHQWRVEVYKDLTLVDAKDFYFEVNALAWANNFCKKGSIH